MLEPIEAITEAAKLIARPAYEDALQPGMRQVGRTGETIGRLINVFTGPLRIGILAAEFVIETAEERLTSKLAHLQPDQIQAPDPAIALPALEGFRANIEHPELQELFLNLIAASADATRDRAVHPRFVEAVRQMSPEEARFFSCISPDQPMVTWINLQASISDHGTLTCEGTFLGGGFRMVSREDYEDQRENLRHLGLVDFNDARIEGHFTDNKVVLVRSKHLGAWASHFTSITAGLIDVPDGTPISGDAHLVHLTRVGAELHRVAVMPLPD